MRTTEYCSTLTPEAGMVVEQARSGEITGLLEYCLRYLHRQAVVHARMFWKASLPLEIDDLLQEAALQMCRRMQAALATDHPIQMLMRNGWGAMRHYCIHHQTTVYTPLYEGRAQAPWYIRSLDAVIPGSEDLTLAEILPGPDVLC